MVVNHSELDALEEDINTRFLESINQQLAREVTNLMKQIEYLNDVNSKLLNYVLSAKRMSREQKSTESFEAIRGYVSLKNKIAEAEEVSRKEMETRDAGEE